MKTLKKLFLTIAVVTMAVVCFAFGAGALDKTGKCGENLTWVLNGETLTISGSGDMTDYNNTGPWGTEIRTLIIEDDVTSIGSNAFNCCFNLSSVTIGNSVETIGKRAFSCCTSLSGVKLPDSIVSIGDAAFEMCSLIGIYIPAGVKYIGENAFSLTANDFFEGISVDPENSAYCSDDYGVLFNKKKTILIKAPSCISGDYIVPIGVEEIKEYAFLYCHELISVTIPESVTVIDYYAFDCDNLETVFYLGSQSSKEDIDQIAHSLADAIWHCNSCLGKVEHTYTNDCDETCDICLKSRIAPHFYKWIIDKDSTCGKTGIKHEECTVCDAKRNENTVIDANGNHNYKWVIDNDSTCGKTGIKHEECTVCDAKRNENTKISATGKHTYDDNCDEICNTCEQTRIAPHNFKWVIDLESTCGAVGIKHRECAACKAVSDENTIIPATNNHQFSGDKDEECNICNRKFYNIILKTYNDTVYQRKRVPPSELYIIPDDSPTRSGYSFAGWSYGKNGDIKYQPADSFAVSNSVTLYAQWDKQCSKYINVTCSECSGEGKVLSIRSCNYCWGKGVESDPIYCDKCEGEGTTHENCRTCAGKGQDYMCLDCRLPVENDYCWYYHDVLYTTCFTCSGNRTCRQSCLNCSGKGVVGYVYYDCHLCDGTGYESETCSNCSGKGKVQKNCSECNGTGKLIRKETSAPGRPVLEDVYDSMVILNTITNGEYSLDGKNWQDSPVFYNLTTGQEYSFYQRYAKTDTTLASPSSVALKVYVHTHTFDNACDKLCNLCEYTRKVSAHIYTDNCDTDCNECGNIRSVTHSYRWVTDERENCGVDGLKHEECYICHIKRNENTVIKATGNHVYDNNCDTTCNECGNIRSVTHSYIWIIDQIENCGINGLKHEECTLCHIKHNENTIIEATGHHIYDNACDTTCNACSAKRSIKHTYTNTCDKNCNVCNATRTVSHKYSPATCTKPKSCIICGATSGKKLGHDYWIGYYTNNSMHWHQCETCGHKKDLATHSFTNDCDSSCNICDVGRTIKHTYTTTTTKATLSKNGKVVKKCSVCGTVSSTSTIYYPKTITLSATSYTYNGKTKTPTVIVKDSKGNALKKDTDYTVKYESGRKSTGKYTVTVTFKGNYSGTKKLYFTITPKTTSKVTATQTTTSVTLKWSKVTGATGYRVFQRVNGKWKTLSNTTKLTYTIKKLKAGTNYTFAVRPYTVDGKDTILASTFTQLKTATKCKTPTLKVTSSKKGVASLSWTNVAGESGYQVYYSTQKDGEYKKVKSYKTDVVTASKSKLTSGKTYYFKIRAYKKTDSGTVYGAWSAVKSIKIK